jgi:hypothetical protein
MKPYLPVIIWIVAMNAGLSAKEPVAPEDNRIKHQQESAKVADEQDELSADVQQLVVEQTIPKVIELLTEVEDIMDEATENLAEADTGGETLAAQTEIIEKILDAARQKQSQGSGSKSGGAMMDMMERMAGKKPGEGELKKGKGEGKGDKPGETSGQGMTGDSDAANEAVDGQSGGKTAARRVPKAAGSANPEIPEEFKKAFDAYNRGAEKKVK